MLQHACLNRFNYLKRLYVARHMRKPANRCLAFLVGWKPLFTDTGYLIFLVSGSLVLAGSVKIILQRSPFDDPFWVEIIDQRNLIVVSATGLATGSILACLCSLVGLLIGIPGYGKNRTSRIEYNTDLHKVVGHFAGKHSTDSTFSTSHITQNLNWPQIHIDNTSLDEDEILGNLDDMINENELIADVIDGHTGRRETYLRSNQGANKNYSNKQNPKTKKGLVDVDDWSEEIVSSADISDLGDNFYKAYFARISTYQSTSISSEVSDSQNTKKDANSASYLTEILETFDHGRFEREIEALDIDEDPCVIIDVSPSSRQVRARRTQLTIDLILFSIIFISMGTPVLLTLCTFCFLNLRLASNLSIGWNPSRQENLYRALRDVQRERDCVFHGFLLLDLKVKPYFKRNCIDDYQHQTWLAKQTTLGFTIALCASTAYVLVNILFKVVKHRRSQATQTLPRRDWIFGVGIAPYIKDRIIQCDIDGEEKMRRISRLWIDRQSKLLDESLQEFA